VIRAALLCCALAGCAGQSSYTVRPFYNEDLKQMVCCEAIVNSSRDIASVSVDAVKTGSDYQIHFTETGVSATQPIQANTAAVAAVAGAVTATANAAAKLTLKP